MDYNPTIARGLMRFKWGNEVNANYAGTTAQMRGTDLASMVRNGAITDPDPFPLDKIARANWTGVGSTPVDNTSGPATTKGSIAEAITGYFPDILTDTVSGVFGPAKDGKSLLRSGALLLLAIIIIAIGVYALVK